MPSGMTRPNALVDLWEQIGAEATTMNTDQDRPRALAHRRSDELSGPKLVKAMRGIILTGLIGK
jgi:hypothetical protein